MPLLLAAGLLAIAGFAVDSFAGVSNTYIGAGKNFTLDLPPRNTALFRNAASRTATVKLKLTDAVSRLSMGYENGDDGL
jgi:hypothetical protein